MNGAPNNRSRLIFVGVILAGAMIALIVILLGGEEKDTGDATGSGTPCESVETPAAKKVRLAAPGGKPPAEGTTATVSTSCGDFSVLLASGEAPKTTASFTFMAEKGVYDDVAFTRIAPGFVIQGGDPTGTQAGNAGYTVTETPPSDVRYTEGVVAMAKGGTEPPGTSGSQFFVVTGAGGANLPPEYALLGKVQSGMDVVQKIAAVGTASGADGPPQEPVVIKSVAINPPGA